MSKIACIAWGSLVWDPGALPISGWFQDGPAARVEFLRQSDSGLVTLVLHVNGTAVRTHWTTLSVGRLDEAIEALRKRERALSSDAIGRWSTGEPAPSLIPDLPEWAASRGIAGAVWTALPSKFWGEAGRVASAADVIAYLGSCTGEVRARAEEYVRRAPRATRTDYRRRIEAQLGWTPPDFDAELTIIRDFTVFLDRQLGVYCDCLAGFERNKTRVELEIPRALRPVGRDIKEGRSVLVWTSLEDPHSPDVIHQRIVRSDEFVAVNSEAGFNEQQICWAIVTFVFSYWNEEIRPQVARARGLQPDNLEVGVFGDLRLLRHNILHNGGMLPGAQHRRLAVLGSLCRPDAAIAFTHSQMKKVFELIHQGVTQLVLYHTGHLAGAPSAEDIVKVAVQNLGTT